MSWKLGDTLVAKKPLYVRVRKDTLVVSKLVDVGTPVVLIHTSPHSYVGVVTEDIFKEFEGVWNSKKKKRQRWVFRVFDGFLSTANKNYFTLESVYKKGLTGLA